MERIDIQLKALRHEIDQLRELARQGKIEWSVVREATVARDLLHANAINISNQIEQMIDAFSALQEDTKANTEQ